MSTYKNILCVAPFSSLTIEQNGDLFPCCAWSNVPGSNLFNKLDPNKSINQNFHRSNIKTRFEFIHNKLDTEKYVNCKKCTTVLNQNHFHNSSANPDIDYISNPTLTNLHFKISNLCNLACRTCDPKSSSLLAKEQDMVFDKISRRKKYEMSSMDIDSPIFSSILENTRTLNQLWFSGGEPLINPAVWKLLEYAHEKNYSKNISVHFNTNGTFRLKEHHLKILKSFKYVAMHISMDGIEEYAEYIRTNVTWNDWTQNLKIFYNNFSEKINDSSELVISVTVSVFNVHILEKIEDYFQKFEKGITVMYNWVFNPKQLSVINLNEKSKNFLFKKYNLNYKFCQWPKVVNMIHQPNIINPSTVSEYIEKLDQNALGKNLYKNYKSFQSLDPEWFNLIQGE
jgi:radical SAM protein with 4Fe4S-binding SPASM domain